MAFFLDKDPEKFKEMKDREMNRILSIPFNKPLTEDLHSKFSKATLLPNAEIDSLLTPQAEALVAYLRNGGLFGYIKVGGGKALISVAIAAAAYRKGLRKIILLIPPRLTIQTVEKVLPWLRRQLPVNLPVHVISGKTKKARARASQQESGLFIMSWSQLSIVDTDELISNIAPELIIADEAHNLANVNSGRYKRVNRWMVMNPETEFVALSGTMGKKSLKDYWHLMKWCLKDNLPMPRSEVELDSWREVLDTTFSEYTSSSVLYPMLTWAKRTGRPELERDIAGYRKAYNHRLQHTSGIVFAVGKDDIGTSITFCNESVEVPDDYPGMERLKELLEQLHIFDKSPDGDIIDFAIHKFRHDYELTAGFYNSLKWPSVEKVMKRRDISQVEAEELLEASKDYHRANQEYHREVRLWLRDYACEALDTPMLLGAAIKRYSDKLEEYNAKTVKNNKPKNPVGSDLYDAWVNRNNFDFDGRLERDKEPVRVCDYKIQALLKWCKGLGKGEGALVWYHNHEVGKWAYEVLKENGIDVVMCDSGQAGYKAINDESNHSRIMIASLTAYKEGLNMQTVKHTYFLQFPRSAAFAEQALGRNHRTGCKYDELIFTTCNSNEFDHNMFSAVLADALFQSQAGSRHKMIYGSYDPPPKIASSAVLKEQGIIQNSIDISIENQLKSMFNK
jgi:hypothetical protein